MSNIATLKLEGLGRGSVVNLYPIGDVHMGSICCDETRLRRVVKAVERDENGYWVMMGDALEAINIDDKRWNEDTVALWIDREERKDIVRAQSNRFLHIISPIIPKCAAWMEGNHERTILSKYKRDIYGEMARIVSEECGREVGIGYTGWLRLQCERGGKRNRDKRGFIGSFHHGFSGARRPGGKANVMETWLDKHECDFAIMGHCHTMDITWSATEYLDQTGRVRTRPKVGFYSSTFYDKTLAPGLSYADWKAYPPMPMGCTYLSLKPFSERDEDVLGVHSLRPGEVS